MTLAILNFLGCEPVSNDKFINWAKIGDISLSRYLRRSIGILEAPEALLASNFFIISETSEAKTLDRINGF